MSSKKIEERNEKIIRGLMKLPPNRRCINCNSLGPQYVCTNFWTFVCTTCSGIHREFTHRVKSVSMAKFTSQEVEALQEGGNQRAREIYLKDWDLQRQRLPDSSNVDKIRDFIKAIYVDYKYAGGKASDKPSRDTQDIGNHEGDTRRASSYHSYSQSPPYEYQYEERRYGRQAGALNRKPGSDRALERKISSFIYSPGRYEDRFANENSGSRISDYSVSSAGDPVRSGNQSPNSQKSFGFGSPPVQPVRDILNEDVRRQTMNSYSEANARRDVNGVPRPQRTTSSGSFGSSDSNSMSSKSVSSGSLFDVISEPEQSVGSQQDKIHSSPFSQSSVNTNVSSMDLFASSFVQLPATSSAPVLDLSLSLKTSHTPSVDLFQQPTPSSALSIDLFQQPSSAPSIDLFQQPSSAPSIDLFQQSAPSSAPAIDLFASSQSSSVQSLDMFANIAHQQSATKMLEKEQSGFPTAENEGWATFDSPPQVASTLGTNDVGCPTRAQAHEFPAVCLKAPASTNTGGKLQPVPSSAGHGLVSPASGLWHGATQALASTSLVQQSWNAFGGSVQTLSQSSFENITQSTEPHVKSFTGPISTQSWDAFQDSTGSVSQTSFGNPPHTNELQGQGFSGQTSTQPWNAFEDPADRHSLASFENLPPKNEPQPLAHNPAAATDQYLSSKVHERPSDNGFQRIIMEERAPMPSGPVNSAVAASSFTPSVLPLVGGPPMYGADRKSTNPFDISYDSDLEPNSMLLDMSSLQATLPNPQLPPAFLNQPWFPQNTGTPYIPTAPQGVLPYMGGQATSPQLQNIAAQSPVAPLGGNPFA